jgi:PST family polysaccharide transporter
VSEATSERPDTATIATNAVRGIVWTGGAQVILQLIQVGTQVALARLLAPSQFGLIGMAMVFIGVAQLLADFGLGSAIVQSKKIDRKSLSTAFWLNCAIGGGLMVLVVALSGVVADFYQKPEVQTVLMVLSVSLFVSALNAVPNAILYKAMNFAAMAKGRVLGTAIGSLTAILLALSGYGIWALVAQPLVGSIMVFAVTAYFARWLPSAVFSLASIRHMISFSAGLLGNSLLFYFTRNTDQMLIGRYRGSEALGYYAMATQLMLYPLNQVASVIIRVLFPTLAQLRDEPEQFRRAYLKSVGAVAFVTFPMMLGLIVVSHDFILVVFGAKWLPMETVLRVLALVGMVQSSTSGVSTILASIGRTQVMFLWAVAGYLISASAYVIGLQWGIEGVAIAYAIAYFATTEFYMGYVFRLVGIPLLDFHRALARPTVAAVTMVVLVGLFQEALGRFLAPEPYVQFAASVSFGILVYAGMSLLINRSLVIELYMRVRTAF